MPALSDQYTQQGWVKADRLFVKVGGTPVIISEGSVKITNAIGQRSTAAFVVEDTAGAYDWQDGTLTQIYQSGSINKLEQSQSDCQTDLTGFSTALDALLTAGTGTINLDYNTTLSGGASLHVNSGSPGAQSGGVEIKPGVAIPANTVVTISLYYNTSVSAGAMRLYDFTNGNSPAPGVTLASTGGGWQRLVYTYTQTQATNDLRFCIRSNAVNQDIWVDAIMVEFNGSASNWVPGLPPQPKNLFSVNQSNVETDTTGFGQAQTVTLTRDTSQFWYGASSLKCVTPGAQVGEGFSAGVAAASLRAGQPYTVSVWLRGSGTVKVRLSAIGTSDIVTSNTITLSNTWTRYSITGTLPGTLSGTYGLVVSTDVTQATTFWADGMQMELGATLTDWLAGQTRTDGLLFAGPLTSAKRTRIGLGSAYVGVYPIDVKAADWHYLADKRIVAKAHTYQTCGFMVRDLIDTVLSQEGVTYVRGVNILSAQQSDVESTDLSTFVSSGVGSVTFSQDTTPANVQHGTASLKVVTGGTSTFEAVYLGQLPVSKFQAGKTYTISVYAKASTGTPTVRFFLDSSAGAIGNVGSITLSTTMTRYTFSVTLPNPITATWIGIRLDTGGVAQALTFWLDANQLEMPQATSWVAGASGVNILTVNQSSVETDTTGFTSVGTGTITLTRDTTQHWTGVGSLKVVMDGTVATQGVRANTPAASFTANRAYTFSVWLYGTGTVRLAVRDDTAGAILTGSPTAVVALGQYWQRAQVTVVMPTALNAGGYSLMVDDNGVAAALTFWIDGLQVEAVVPTGWEVGGATATIQEGPTVVNYSAPYVPGSKMMDDLAQLAGFYWQIDQNKVAWFLLPTSIPAPFTYDGTQGVYGTQTVDNGNPYYRNSQWIVNIPDLTLPQTETRKGDTTTKGFAMSYPLNNVPTITVNGTAQTVGIKGIDDVNHTKQWYWSKGDPVIAQEANNAALIGTDTLAVTYIGQWISNIYSQSPSLVNSRAAIDGTSGIVEEAHSDPTIYTGTAGFTVAAALLNRYGVQGKQVVFQTRAGGLAPGQLLTMNMLSAGWKVQNVQALIEQVDIAVKGQWLVFTVTAIVGPFNQNWVQFYQRLAGLGQTIPGSAGSSLNVSLLASFTAAWNWAATYTATVFACPIIGPTQACGPTKIVC